MSASACERIGEQLGEVGEALRPFGFQPPAWYLLLQREAGPAAQDPARLAAQAAAA